jgi:CheY-like chemotaxis protein
MVGLVPARDEDTARLTGARGDFVGSLGRRVEALRVSLRAIEQSPGDAALKNSLLRRVHALSSAARVLGFASVAEALSEAEKRLRSSDFSEVARSLDLLPSLLLGVPVSLRAAPDARADRVSTTWPLSVLIFGAQALADAMQAIPDTHVECERTEDLARAREQAQLFGPDLAIVDADCPGARELVEAFAKDPLVEPVPLVVIGDFARPEAASAYIALGAARVLSKPVSPQALQRTVVELRAIAAQPRAAREPLGELSVEALSARIAAEIRRGLLEAVEPSSRATSVAFGDGADVMGAVWGAIARVRELVTLRSGGAVRFDSGGPEGAVPIAAWSNEERRAGERGTAGSVADSVALHGRRIVVADDDPAVVWFMSGLLKALGVEVLEAHDGARALALTFDAWPDLVVSDVLMPKLDGFSLCHEIKRDVAVRDVPVILLSWKEDLLQRVRELGGGADGYLRKEAAASTVAERLREVLRPRARVEQRIAAGADARGRLDGLTPRLILELASAAGRDVRVGIRDAVYLYEVQVRRGKLCSATRSAADGRFERGEFVLAALLGVSAGRFLVETDASPCRVDFEGTPTQVLKAPIGRARAALESISAGALVGVTRVHIAAAMIEGYLACTPEPARALLERVIAGASPRDLITSGAVAPRLLEAVLSDVARRGAILDIERLGTEPPALRGAPPAELEARAAALAREPAPSAVVPSGEPSPTPAAQATALARERAPSALTLSRELSPEPANVAAEAPAQPVSAEAGPASDPPTFEGAPPASVRGSIASEVSADDAAWFSLQIESGTPGEGAPVGPAVAALPTESSDLPLPFSREVTPAVDRRWAKLTEGVFSDPGTLQGVGIPEVRPRQPSAEDLDALASALTEESPGPGSASLAASVPSEVRPEVLAANATLEAALDPFPEPQRAPDLSAPPPSMSSNALARPIISTRVSPLKASRPPTVPAPVTGGGSGRFFSLVLLGGLAFGAAYLLVSYYRAQTAPEVIPLPAAPASS